MDVNGIVASESLGLNDLRYARPRPGSWDGARLWMDLTHLRAGIDVLKK